jgi:hypothetical protein
LEPAFIRQALARVTGSSPAAVRERSRQAEFRGFAAALAVPLLWGSLAYACAFSLGLMRFFTLVAPAPLALLIGWMSGRKGAGFAAGSALILTLAPTLALLVDRLKVQDGEGVVILYILIGSLVAGWLGRQGARLRDYYFPLASPERLISRQELERLVGALQQQLETRTEPDERQPAGERQADDESTSNILDHRGGDSHRERMRYGPGEGTAAGS